jgi:Ca2+:H+ antiporter
MPGTNQGTNGSADERTPLTNGNNSHSGGRPLREDDRAWVSYPMSFFHLAWLTLASNYVNILLVFVPVGIALGATGADPTTVFIINFIAIVPLASLLSFATEELSAKLGQTIGGLMNATFGNAVELIVSLLVELSEYSRQLADNQSRLVSLR